MPACEAALGMSLVLLLLVSAAQAMAWRNGQKEQTHALGLFRVGIGLSACSYALLLPGMPHGGLTQVFSFFFCVAGTMLIWRGWKEQRRLYRASVQSRPASREKDNETERLEAGLAEAVSVQSANPTVFSRRAQQAMFQAYAEAGRCQSPVVETDHLLLGLLRDPHCVAVLSQLGVSTAGLHSALAATEKLYSDPSHFQSASTADPFTLTRRAQQVLVMAAQEAHRFGKAEIGTEHLLLGLVLIGTGPAALALFQADVTVDGMRLMILHDPVGTPR